MDFYLDNDDIWGGYDDDDDLFLGYEDWGDADYSYIDSRSKRFPKKALHLYTEAERRVIEAACRKRGKESPWDYKARIERMKREGKETKEEYRERKAKEPVKLEKKQLAEELPVPKKPSHKATLSLQQQRNDAGMTQKQAADAVNIPVKMLQEWEKGSLKPSGPKFGKLKTIYKRKIAQKSKK